MYHVQQRDAASIIEVNGELNTSSGPALTSAIDLAELNLERPIVVSLVGYSRCDSNGLRVLVSAKNRLEGRLLFVVPARSRLNGGFDATGLAERLSPYPSIYRAVHRSTPTALSDYRRKVHPVSEDTRSSIFGPPPRRRRKRPSDAEKAPSHFKAYADLIPMMRTVATNGRSLREIAAMLDAAGHTTLHGDRWCAVQVSRVLSRP